MILSCFGTNLSLASLWLNSTSCNIITLFLQILMSVAQLISTCVVKFVQTQKEDTPAAVTQALLPTETSVMVSICMFFIP